jgi:hypothetical protein
MIKERMRNQEWGTGQEMERKALNWEKRRDGGL